MKKITWIMLALCTLASGCSKNEDEENLLKPGVPQNVVATLDVTAIKVSWDAVEDATYSIYRSADDVYYNLMASGLNIAIYTDNVPLTGVNYYRVKAKVKGVESEFSDVAKAIYNIHYVNGHKAVDLGLSVKWATCNVGADSPGDYGDYFAWGDIAPKEEYAEENSITWGKEFGSICGDAKYDAATANWGAPWRLPTKEECQELVDKCTWERTSQGGHNGWKMTGPNGNSIFLPNANVYYGTEYDRGSNGYYWSGTPYESGSNYAYILYFNSGSRGVDWGSRYNGISVRPVTD